MIRIITRPSLSNIKNVRFKTDRKILEEIIRVDHAGELGADRIYAGQMAILGQTSKGPLIKHMWDQEKHHKATFEDLINKHRVRPTVMTPIWNIAGFALGTVIKNEKPFLLCSIQVQAQHCWVKRQLWHALLQLKQL